MTFDINAADDAIHSDYAVIIDGGLFNLATGDDAIHASESIDINDGAFNISKCYEGVESALITINGGNISIVSTDDSFNATRERATEQNDGSCLYIKGGLTVLNTSGGDGLDSNGNIEMTGGTLIVHGPPSQPEVGIDVNGSFNMNSGFLFATGPNSGNMIEGVSNSSGQYSLKIIIKSTLSSSMLFHLEDAEGNNIVTFKPVRTIYYIIFSSAGLHSGSSYSIYTGGNSTGIYTDGIYSGGTLRKTFTVTSRVTSVSF